MSAHGTTFDVAVVGAGIIGCSIAYEIARAGRTVAVLDDRPPGHGATRASAGILAPFVEGHGSEELRTLCAQSLRLYDDFVARVSADADVSVPYRRSGTLSVAMDDAEARRLSDAGRALHAAGVECETLDASTTRALEPALAAGVVASLLVPPQGFVAPEPLVEAILRALTARGGQLVDTRCRSVTVAPPGARLDTPRGTIRAGTVVIAAGSWSGAIAVRGATPPPVHPVKGQLVHLATTEMLFGRVIWGERCYLVPWPDGTVLVGGTVEHAGFDEVPTPHAVRTLLDAATQLIPTLDQARFREVRVGLRPGTGDELPLIGPLRDMPNLVYATGHYRNGIMLAPLTAALVADLVIRGVYRDELERLRPDRPLASHPSPDARPDRSGRPS